MTFAQMCVKEDCARSLSTLQVAFVIQIRWGLQGETLQQVMAAAARILGGDVSSDQPLMEAGLDSLGALSSACAPNCLTRKMACRVEPRT